MLADMAAAGVTGPGGPAAVRAVVIVIHGGQSASLRPTSPAQPAVLRMIPVSRAIRHMVGASGVAVIRPRLRLRGWNGAQASPVGDVAELLEAVPRRFGPVPVVLVGHSLGARAALRAAGHPSVIAAAGLAPWLPAGEPTAQLAGRRLLLVHGTADTTTSPAMTWQYARDASDFATVGAVAVDGGDHAMLRRARLWHRLAAEFTSLALGVPGRDRALRQVVAAAQPGGAPITL
jgi:pimeloyl-ACP methyl ester carboxylesterase